MTPLCQVPYLFARGASGLEFQFGETWRLRVLGE